MSLIIIITIMLSAGLVGGVINYFLPANIGPNGEKLRHWGICILMGVGASIVVPLFLELVQSKLMDDIYYDQDPDKEPWKNYFLFLSYCFLAAAAGTRFITSIMDSVIKDQQIKEQKKEIEETKIEKEKTEEEKEKAVEEKVKIEEEKNKIEKVNIKVAMNNRKSAEQQEAEVLNELRVNSPSLPKILPPTHLNDPQKGRFGGMDSNNNRILKAEVKGSLIPMYYKVKLWVESTDPQNDPLKDEVILYLHDSFHPSVVTIKPGPDGKAMKDDIMAYGAFTVGAVVDQGQTLLELDLADQSEFPEEFRSR